MKNNFYVLLLCIIITSCVTTYITERSTNVKVKNYTYNEHINFTIKKVDERGSLSSRSVNYGFHNGMLGFTSISKPDKGNKFAVIHITMKNTSDQRQEVNLYDFVLIAGKDSIKYVPEYVLTRNFITLTDYAEGYVEVKKHKFMSRQLAYNIPLYYSINTLLVANKKINIEYIRE